MADDTIQTEEELVLINQLLPVLCTHEVTYYVRCFNIIIYCSCIKPVISITIVIIIIMQKMWFVIN